MEIPLYGTMETIADQTARTWAILEEILEGPELSPGVKSELRRCIDTLGYILEVTNAYRQTLPTIVVREGS